MNRTQENSDLKTLRMQTTLIRIGRRDLPLILLESDVDMALRFASEFEDLVQNYKDEEFNEKWELLKYTYFVLSIKDIDLSGDHLKKIYEINASYSKFWATVIHHFELNLDKLIEAVKTQ